MNELSIPPDDRAALLAQIDRGELVTTLSREQQQELLDKLKQAILYGELTSVTVRQYCGHELHGLPAHLSTMANMGTGYLRHCRDVIRALRRAQARKEQG